MNFFKANVAPFYFKLAVILIGIYLLGYLAIVGKEIFCPLIFGLLFSILLLPIARFLERKCRIPRGGAAALAVILLLLAIGVLFYVIGSQLTSLAQDWPLFKEQLAQSLHNFQDWIALKFHIDIAKQMSYIDSATVKIANQTTSMIGATVVSVSSILLFLVFILIDTFFLLFYRRLFLKFLIRVFKEENSKVVLDIVEQVQFIMRKYILGLLLQMLVVASVCCVAFLILGIRYAILLGLITGLFNVIPYIGIFTALLLNVVITFATTAMAGKVLLVVIIVVCMHLIDSNILLPLIVGSKVKINPFITLIGVVAGEMMWGIPGMFLAIPVIAITKIIFDRVETLEPWGMVMGEDDIGQKQPKVLAITSRKKLHKL